MGRKDLDDIVRISTEEYKKCAEKIAGKFAKRTAKKIKDGAVNSHYTYHQCRFCRSAYSSAQYLLVKGIERILWKNGKGRIKEPLPCGDCHRELRTGRHNYEERIAPSPEEGLGITIRYGRDPNFDFLTIDHYFTNAELAKHRELPGEGTMPEDETYAPQDPGSAPITPKIVRSGRILEKHL